MTKAEQFSPEERAAMKDRARELKAQTQGADGEAAALAKIAQMPAAEQVLAAGFHELVKDVAPQLTVKTWYGMPAYATPGKQGKVMCFFQSGAKMQTRYCTVGFSDAAHLDDTALWATTFAVIAWNEASQSKLRALLRQAVGEGPPQPATDAGQTTEGAG